MKMIIKVLNMDNIDNTIAIIDEKDNRIILVDGEVTKLIDGRRSSYSIPMLSTMILSIVEVWYRRYTTRIEPLLLSIEVGDLFEELIRTRTYELNHKLLDVSLDHIRDSSELLTQFYTVRSIMDRIDSNIKRQLLDIKNGTSKTQLQDRIVTLEKTVRRLKKRG